MPDPAPAVPAVPDGIPLRFLREIGTRAVLRVYWDGTCGSWGYHDAVAHLADSGTVEDFALGGVPSDHPIECWPTTCDRCGAARPPITDLPSYARQVNHTRLYEAPGGEIVEEREMRPGDCYYSTWLHNVQDGVVTCHYWDDCTEPHLNIMVPGTSPHGWDCMSRANNCDKKEDRRHRCWCVHGDPSRGELVTIDKSGVPTCGAGGGSILVPGFHGRVEGGILRG